MDAFFGVAPTRSPWPWPTLSHWLSLASCIVNMKSESKVHAMYMELLFLPFVALVTNSAQDTCASLMRVPVAPWPSALLWIGIFVVLPRGAVRGLVGTG